MLKKIFMSVSETFVVVTCYFVVCPLENLHLVQLSPEYFTLTHNCYMCNWSIDTLRIASGTLMVLLTLFNWILLKLCHGATMRHTQALKQNKTKQKNSLLYFDWCCVRQTQQYEGPRGTLFDTQRSKEWRLSI